MNFIYDEVMEEYQANEKRMDFIIAADIYDEAACEFAKKISEIYSSKLQQIGEAVASQGMYPDMTVSEIILRLGKPVIMLEGEVEGEYCGMISYFENKIDENEVIEVEFVGELECLLDE